jgi:sulfite oxidase
VLSAVGIGEGAYYVAFVGMDEAQMEGQQHNFGSSITLERALSTDVLLAYEMNNEPLTPQHGFPLRVIVPGCIGVKSVKWLRSITLQEQPSTNYFYAHDYKLFPPDVTKETADWNCGKVLEEIPLNSVICDPQAGQTCKAGPQRIQGYALTGQGASIERVELSTDGGVHWLTTNIVERSDPWAWCLWEANVDLAPGPCQLVVRAWDTRQHTQPERMEPLWNFKGYVNNAWHRVQVQVV